MAFWLIDVSKIKEIDGGGVYEPPESAQDE